MFYAGNYPFSVRILNAFDPKLKIEIHVRRYHHLNYFSDHKVLGNSHETIKGRIVIVEDIPPPGEGKLHKIKGGESSSFHMYYDDEYLEIQLIALDPTESQSYKISIGTKAKCLPSLQMNLPISGTFDLSRSNPYIANNPYYAGGSWEFPNETLSSTPNWKMTIKKFGPDPEDDDVIVGPDPPD